MSHWKLIRLEFGRNVAHFGELGIGIEETSERIRSDTLFSAWLSAYARLFPRLEVEEFIKQYQVKPKFRLSSTFIYQDLGNRIVDYLPRPLKPPLNYPKDDLAFVKTYKTLNYLPLEVWRRWYQGEGFSDRQELIDKTTGKATGKATGELSRSGAFRYREAYEVQKLPKIAVDRMTRATNLYHTGMVQYRCEQNAQAVQSLSGLYFLAEFLDAEIEKTFLAVLDFLGGEGIGGERSSGAGQFTRKALELSSEWDKTVNFSGGTHHSLISLFWQHPLPPDLLNGSSYELQERGGWITSVG
ncbi:MAG TPA: type III-A CRISPR-associated RAMP protein Csm4, partial [Leptolyngbya sp.]|nr:type III-A CRISPR-associated RAMP protein Csm4 [Leptolyngbya sp.]